MSDDALVCRQFVALVSDWFDGTLAPAPAARMARHLASCRSCATYYEQMRITVAWLRELRDCDGDEPRSPAPLRLTDASEQRHA